MSINRIVLTGRMVRDPEIRTTPSGQQVVNFSIAVQKRIKPADPNERDAFFFRIVAWNKQAEFISNYAHKGRLVGVEGRLEQRRYTGTDGLEREVCEVIADNVQLLDRPRDDQGVEDEPSETAAGVAAVGGSVPSSDDYDPFAEE